LDTEDETLDGPVAVELVRVLYLDPEAS